MADISLNSDNNVYLNSLSLESDDSVQSDATVTFTLKDLDDEAISGAEGVSMPATATAGQYRGVLADTVALVYGKKYNLFVNATAATGEKREFRKTVVAGYE